MLNPKPRSWQLSALHTKLVEMSSHDGAMPTSPDVDHRSDTSDILIPDVPDDVLAAIDANARRLGLSRAGYLRRALSLEPHVVAP